LLALLADGGSVPPAVSGQLSRELEAAVAVQQPQAPPSRTTQLLAEAAAATHVGPLMNAAPDALPLVGKVCREHR
jgi:hypothetical protein